MASIKNGLIGAIKEGYGSYGKHGARSNKKLIPIHKWIAEVVSSRLGPSYEVRALGLGGEVRAQGKYYKKNLDIAVLRDEKVIVAISFKFVTSNYKQNSNNYFENLLGETANIRRANIGLANLLILRAETPYYDKASGGKRGKLKRVEKITSHDLEKYLKLSQDNDFPHKPDVMGITILANEGDKNWRFQNLSRYDLSPEIQDYLSSHFDIDSFFKKVEALCTLKS